MKPSYEGFEAKKPVGFVELPPVGAYQAEIEAVRFVIGQNGKRDTIELMMEITEGEYKGRYHEVYKDQSERFGTVKYKGIFRLFCPRSQDDTCRRMFEANLWCVEQSNPGYTWDWDENKLKGKKVGISVRKRLYTYNGQDRETTEIGQFETIDDVRNGKCKPQKERDQRSSDGSGDVGTDGGNFTDVSAKVDVPW